MSLKLVLYANRIKNLFTKLAYLLVGIACIIEAFFYPIRDFLPVDMMGDGDVYMKVVEEPEAFSYGLIDLGLMFIGLVFFALFFVKQLRERDKK